ncbi:MAG: hypothetical protein JWM48_1114 [Mycobacterium sp.]|jgi:multimeric flavodoxin WrbA|nr:hypothetical protein [Mycobacterium sp.]MCW2744564.1 hypothetical protein [Mycobacterium sp.]
MPRLLVVHHSPTRRTRAMLDAVVGGATDDTITGVDVVVREALAAGPDDALAADAYLLGTTANIGYMSGALKHFFDLSYNACLDVTARRPYGLWVHGNNDTTGAVASVRKVTTGMAWREAFEPVSVLNEPSEEDLGRCYELGGTLAALLLAG